MIRRSDIVRAMSFRRVQSTSTGILVGLSLLVLAISAGSCRYQVSYGNQARGLVLAAGMLERWRSNALHPRRVRDAPWRIVIGENDRMHDALMYLWPGGCVTYGGSRWSHYIPVWQLAVPLMVLALVLRTVRRRSEARASARSGHCPTCGYDLRGSPEGKCPECGCATKLGKGGLHDGTVT